MVAYYNEFDPYAAEWLRNLISAGHIAPGDVDERSISDVRPDDLRGYTQAHFFAGIGVWSHALRLAGWPDDRPVWTMSCPCQPFSAAGKGKGFADERHLWPAAHHFIRECRPAVVLGEQVASKDGLEWLDLVQADLEGTGYACAAVDTCAAGFGAPHIRQRLYWVGERLGDPHHQGLEERRGGSDELAGAQGRQAAERPAGLSGVHGGLADNNNNDRREAGLWGRPVRAECDAEHGDSALGLADADEQQQHGGRHAGPRGRGELADGSTTGERPSPTNGFWRDADWLFCRDGKWRPVEPGTFPLAHGAPARVGRLRAYGNAIVAQAAQGFIEAYLEARP